MLSTATITIHAGDAPVISYHRTNDGSLRWLDIESEDGRTIATAILNPAMVAALRLALSAFDEDRG